MDYIVVNQAQYAKVKGETGFKNFYTGSVASCVVLYAENDTERVFAHILSADFKENEPYTQKGERQLMPLLQNWVDFSGTKFFYCNSTYAEQETTKKLITYLESKDFTKKTATATDCIVKDGVYTAGDPGVIILPLIKNEDNVPITTGMNIVAYGISLDI